MKSFSRKVALMAAGLFLAGAFTSHVAMARHWGGGDHFHGGDHFQRGDRMGGDRGNWRGDRGHNDQEWVIGAWMAARTAGRVEDTTAAKTTDKETAVRIAGKEIAAMTDGKGRTACNKAGAICKARAAWAVMKDASVTDLAATAETVAMARHLPAAWITATEMAA